MDTNYYRKERPKRSLITLLRKAWKSNGFRIMVFVIIPVFSFITFSNKGILQRTKLEAQRVEMEEKVRSAQAEQRALKEQSKALDSDPKTIEKVAREKYGMIKEGETVYKVRKDK